MGNNRMVEDLRALGLAKAARSKAAKAARELAEIGEEMPLGGLCPVCGSIGKAAGYRAEAGKPVWRRRRCPRPGCKGRWSTLEVGLEELRALQHEILARRGAQALFLAGALTTRLPDPSGKKRRHRPGETLSGPNV